MGENSLEKKPEAAARWGEFAREGGPAMVFEVSGYSCGLPLRQIREVVPMCELAKPPGLPPLLEGLLNLRGEITPVVRLDALFDLAPVVLRRHSQLVVLREPAALALLADRVRGIAAVEASALLDCEGSVFNDCLEGVLPSEGGLVHFLRVGKLLLVQEKRRIEKLQQMAQRRLAELEEAGS